MIRFPIAFAVAWVFLVPVGASRGAPADTPDKDEIVRRRQIERELGKVSKGYFLVAMWEITSAQGEPVNLTHKLNLFDGRAAAVDAIAEYLQGLPAKRNFRLVHRFNANPVDKQLAETVFADFQKQLKYIAESSMHSLPQTVEVGAGTFGPNGSHQLVTGPKGLKITLVQLHPKTKKPGTYLLQMP